MEIDTYATLSLLLRQIQLAGVLYALDRLAEGIAKVVDWKEFPDQGTRAEVWWGAWMLHAFLSVL